MKRENAELQVTTYWNALVHIDLFQSTLIAGID